MDDGEPSALANGAGGGLWRRGHDDGVRGGAPVSIGTALALTKLEWRAREEATGCWGDGGAMAVVLEWLGMSCARLWRRRSCGKCCWRCETAKETEAKQMGAGLSAGGRWREEGAPRRVVACADRPAATRGRFPRHAAAKA